MSEDDVLFGYRLRLFTLAEEIGVRAACRAMGVHHSTYYRWKAKVDRWGLEALRVRERRRPRMPNQLGLHIEAQRPGGIVGVDCFYVGRLAGTKGTVWQYTAIDIASGFAWAELHTSERNPVARHTKSLVHRVASELATAGWKLRAVISDNGS